MSTFTKDKPCQSLKIWSDQELTKELIDYGVLIYYQYNQDLIKGESSASGCGFFNESSGLSGFAKKTKGGLGTIFVRKEKTND